MPVVTLRLDETAKSIKSSMYQQLVKDVIDSLGVEYDHLTTVFTGMEVSRTDNDTSVSNQTRVNLPSTISQRRVIAKVTSRYDEDSITPTVVTQRDTPPIFHDASIDALMALIYIKSDTTIDITYTCPSESEAERLLDDIRVKLSQTRNILHHTVEYNVILPKVAEDFITDVYDLKNRLFPVPLSDYVGAFMTRRSHVITDLSSTDNARMAVRERQTRVVGVFDFSPLPDAIDRSNDTNTYTVTIPYKIKLDIPTQLYISYPTMVANRPMPTKYLTFVKESREKQMHDELAARMYTYSLDNMSIFEAQRQLSDRLNMSLPLVLPMFDSTEGLKPHPGYVVLTSVLVSVDETDMRTIGNLKEIDTDYCLDNRFLELIAATELRYIVKPYESFFYIGLHQKNKYYDNDMLDVDSQLNIKANKDLQLLRPVRFTLSICIDPTMLRSEAFARLCKHRELLLYYMTELMLARVNYPTERVSTGLTDEHLMKILLDLCIQGCRNEEGVFLKNLIRLLNIEQHLADKFASLIFNDYPQLYRCLMKHTVIETYYNRIRQRKKFTINDNYRMRTVLTTYVDVTAKLGELTVKVPD